MSDNTGLAKPRAPVDHEQAVSSNLRDKMELRNHERRIYLRYVGISFLLFSVAVSIQFGLVLDSFRLQYLLVPIVLSLGFGLLFGRVAVLKERLGKQTRQFRAVADFAQEFTYYRGLDGAYEYVSPSCEAVTGYSASEFYARPSLMDELVHPEDHERWHRHVHHINQAGEAESMDIRIIARDGRIIWINHLCGTVVDEEGNQIGVRSANIDISERKAFEAHIERMAYYDPLTDLPNRHSLTRELETLVRRYKENEQGFALLFLDLDRFKHINDSFGHELGDRLLLEVAQRMKSCCSEKALITRFGGDEFVIVVPQINNPQPALDFARKLLEQIEQTIELDAKEFYISGSIGIVLHPYDGRDAVTLIRHADAAMFKAKKEMHGSIQLYSADLIDSAAAFVSTENRIRQALKKREFIAYYQPKVDFEAGVIVGTEALARWQTPDRGLVMPSEFIAIAEETGLIENLGIQMLEQACEQLYEWQKQSYGISVAVNISGVQLAAPDFIDTVSRIITESRCNPAGLELEITEQVFLADTVAITEKLWRLKDLGVSIAMDDFGTGYSSLSYLKRLPIDTIKIDRSFTRDIYVDSRDVAILRAILLLSNDLHLNHVIEGIETEEQLQLIQSLGCQVGQGYLFYKPMPASILQSVLSEGQIKHIPVA